MTKEESYSNESCTTYVNRKKNCEQEKRDFRDLRGNIKTFL